MSEDIYIGLSRVQIARMLIGELIGKRPYYKNNKFPKTKEKYDGTIRVHVFMLSDKERKKEPDSAFEWS